MRYYFLFLFQLGFLIVRNKTNAFFSANASLYFIQLNIYLCNRETENVNSN